MNQERQRFARPSQGGSVGRSPSALSSSTYSSVRRLAEVGAQQHQVQAVDGQVPAPGQCGVRRQAAPPGVWVRDGHVVQDHAKLCGRDRVERGQDDSGHT